MKRATALLTVTAALVSTAARAQEEGDDPIAQAEAKVAAGDVAGAVELLQKQARDDAAPGEVSLMLGRLLVRQNELDLAMDALAAAAEKLTGAEKAEALGRLSLAQEMRGMDAEANASAEAAAAADAGGAWSLLARSRAAARAGDGEQAVELARRAAAEGGVDAQVALGFALEATGELAAAEEAYRKALAEAPEDLGVTVGLARVLRRTNRAAEAEPLLQKALAAAPGAVPVYKESARVKIALGRPMEAMGDAATAAALAPDDPEAQAIQKEATVARALSYLSDPNQAPLAIPDLQSLVAEEPDLVVAHVGLGQAYIAQQQPDEAKAALDKALALDPDNPEALYHLGHLYVALKQDFQSAVEPLAKAVAADPGNATYRAEYGLALKQVGRYAEAIAELEKVVETPGYDRADAWIFLGEAHLGAQNYRQAVEALQKAAEIAPDFARIEAMLAWSYFGLKDADNFKKHGAKARELGWTDAQLLDRLKRVEAGEAIR